jgi:hypothetical protein
MPLWMCVLIGAVAVGLDWSAIGPDRIRDRLASVLYVPCFAGFFAAIGLTSWIAATLLGADPVWRVVAVIVGIVTIAHWIGAMAPPISLFGRWGRMSLPRAGGKKAGGSAGGGRHVAGRGGGASPSTGTHINTNLVAHSAGVAIALQMMMPGSRYEQLLAAISTGVTGVSTAVGTQVGAFLGFH